MQYFNNLIQNFEHIWKIVHHFVKLASFIKDCFLDNHPKSLCFGLFDGHGGAQVSLYLEKNMADCVK